MARNTELTTFSKIHDEYLDFDIYFSTPDSLALSFAS